MNKISKRILTICTVITLTSIAVILFVSNDSVSNAFCNNMSSIMNDVNKTIKDEKSDIRNSSNPYDFINKNESYNNIVDMGIEVLPELITALDESTESGLEEYIYAIAIEKITDVDLRSQSTGWSDGQEFKREYKAFIRNAEDQINYIIENDKFSSKEKRKQLEKYGVYALPYISSINNKNRSVNEFADVEENIKKNFQNNTSKEITSKDIQIISAQMDEIINN